MQIAKLWTNDEAQDIAEYALLLAVILVITIATINAIGANATVVFSKIASTLASVS
ncbi:MAG: hypothetical protein ACE14M_03250 [Terriglobales bacterium]